MLWIVAASIALGCVGFAAKRWHDNRAFASPAKLWFAAGVEGEMMDDRRTFVYTVINSVDVQRRLELPQRFDIAAGTLENQIQDYFNTVEVPTFGLILYNNKKRPAIKGTLTASAALEKLFTGTGCGSTVFGNELVVLNCGVKFTLVRQTDLDASTRNASMDI